MSEELQQYQREWLKTASPAEVITAYQDGLLTELLSPAPPVAPTEVYSGRERPAQWSRADLVGLDSAAVVAARVAGHLDDLLAGRKPETSGE